MKSTFYILKSALLAGAFFLVCSLHAQNILELLPGSEKVIVEKDLGRIRLLGSVNFNYHGNTMFCDSAYYYNEQQTVYAYGKVHIKKDDINLYCDSLYYNGNQKFAKLWGHVRVRDKAYKVTTDSLDYDVKLSKAIYKNKGQISSITSNEKVSSKFGYFYPKTGTCFFSGNVNYEKDDLKMTTDTLQFSYEKQLVYFFGPTKIVNDSITILCKKGWFNVKDEEATLYKRAEIIQANNITKGDTLYYHGKNKNYEGKGNVFHKDFKENMVLSGNHFRSMKLERKSFVTGNAISFKVINKDTLFVHADSLIVIQDSTFQSKRMDAYRHVRIFSKDVQGKADSSALHIKENKLELFKDPIFWAKNAELKGVKMDIFFHDSILDKVWVQEKATAVMELDSGKYYNQIAGKEFVAYFKNNNLTKVDVSGNAHTLFYPEEEVVKDSLKTVKRMGMNRLLSSELRIYLDSGEVKSITYFDKPDGIFYPMNQISSEEQFIKNFQWNPHLRPKDPISMMRRDEN
ncbi:MAG: hypothetical protein RL264_35 [Bacteroidota bacterium]|jgi:lipopolysaccharide export system protein LptA